MTSFYDWWFDTGIKSALGRDLWTTSAHTEELIRARKTCFGVFKSNRLENYVTYPLTKIVVFIIRNLNASENVSKVFFKRKIKILKTISSDILWILSSTFNSRGLIKATVRGSKGLIIQVMLESIYILATDKCYIVYFKVKNFWDLRKKMSHRYRYQMLNIMNA